MVSPKALTHPNTSHTDFGTHNTRFSVDKNISNTLGFATFGLHPAWKPAYEWAAKNDVITALFQAANATYLRDMPIAVGTLLEFIVSDYSAPLIQEWAHNENSAKPLLLLLEAALADPQILRDFPSLSKARSVERQFHKILESHYLIALLTQDLPLCEHSDRVWLNTLKLWLLTHAINRSLLGNTQDNWIRHVASKLRISCRQAEGWRKIFLSLKTNATDFDEISRTLKHKAESLLTKNKSSGLSLVERQLLNAIVNVAELNHAKDDVNHDSLNLIECPPSHPKNDECNSQPITEQIGEDENSDFGNSRWISAEADIAENVVEYDVDSELSFTHQRLQGNSILLYCTEELQYLPLSWNKLNLNERFRLERWISESTASPQPELRYLSSVVETAINLGRSFKRTLEIHISKETNKEWGLNPATLTFNRLPPRRQPGWRPKSLAMKTWITPEADKQFTSAAPSIEAILKERIMACSTAKCIGDLWDANWYGTAEQLLTQQLSLVSQRVTSSMLANLLPQRVYQSSGDQTFTRLISSHPKTALPGACAYASWSSEQISNVWAPGTVFEMPFTDNAMGSILDPIESLLINSIQSAVIKIQKLQPKNNLIAFHNAYSSYLTVALLAATGVRPVNDPFESLNHFDFDEQFVYVSDKASSELRHGRIIPLSSDLCHIIKNDYLNHLALLSRQIYNINPGLAESISAINSERSRATLPFFFLLSENGMSWKSISEKEIISIGLFDWPLPLNHFRHRISRRLRRENVDPEVIDSILGHAETGSATHGDFSFRVWKDDMHLARLSMESAYKSLGFTRLHNWQRDSIGVVTRPTIQSNFMTPTDFGVTLREKQRLKRAKEIVADAHLLIEQFLKSRTIPDLNESEFDQLSQILLFTRHGMPHTNGYLKYQILLKRSDREWNNRGRKAKISKRYQAIPEEKTPFTSASPRALAIFQKIQNLHSTIPQAKVARIGIHDCAVIAVTQLCIENRISEKSLLADILYARNFRLVILNNTPYLEYAENLDSGDGHVPTKRYLLSDYAAQLLDRIKSKRHSKSQHIPDVLAKMAGILVESGRLMPDINTQSFVKALAELVDQVSVITMPGILAGYLAGRVRSFSLLWNDWARLELGYPILIDATSNKEAISSAFSSVDSRISASAATPEAREIGLPSLQKNACALLGDIRTLIDKSILTSSTPHTSRTELARKIQKSIEAYDGRVSTAIQLLVRWTNSNIFRKKNGKLIELTSIIRYLTALTHIFKEVAYSADILSMDDEDITFFYCTLLQSSKAKDTKYVVDRLIDFHRWAKREYAVEDPDWLELPEAFSTSHVSPGLITEHEYQRALLLLLNSKSQDRRSQLAAPLLLMLCYRFGLRGGEALGMLRSDIDISDQLTIVYIQNNRFRKLKTQTSRRQVPLIFNLSAIEHDILNMWLTETESIYGDNLSAGLFADSHTDTGLMNVDHIKRRAIAALKIATTNVEINLHHARHSAANYVALAVTQIRLSFWEKASPVLQVSDASNVEAMLLGRTGPTRRKAWAVSRFLGHVRRETTFGNYLHFLGEMSDLYTSQNKDCGNTHKLKNAIILDNLQRIAEIDASLLEQLEPKPTSPTPSHILKLMRLIARGKPILEAARSLGIANHIANNLHILLTKVGGKIKLSSSKLSSKQIETPEHLKLIWRLKEPTWNRLIEFATTTEKQKSLCGNLNANINDIIEIIGYSRQILLWEEQHFALVTAFLDYMKIESTHYTIIRSNQTTEQFDELIKRYKISTVLINDIKKEKTFQLDTAHTCDGKYSVTTRCALIINESDSRVIRNSVELLATFVAFSMSLIQ